MWKIGAQLNIRERCDLYKSLLHCGPQGPVSFRLACCDSQERNYEAHARTFPAIRSHLAWRTGQGANQVQVRGLRRGLPRSLRSKGKPSGILLSGSALNTFRQIVLQGSQYKDPPNPSMFTCLDFKTSGHACVIL